MPALQRPTHATHVIYVTLTIKLGTVPLWDVHTRVRAVIQVCVIAVPAPQRPHADDTRELTSHSRVRVRVGVRVRVRVRVVSQVCCIAVPAPNRHTHAARVVYRR